MNDINPLRYHFDKNAGRRDLILKSKISKGRREDRKWKKQRTEENIKENILTHTYTGGRGKIHRSFPWGFNPAQNIPFNVEMVIIHEEVEVIEQSAFGGCKNLKCVVFAKSKNYDKSRNQLLPIVILWNR